MKQGYEFIITSTYDRPAFQALSKASYHLFQRHSMATRAYPALGAMTVLILGILLFNWEFFSVWGRIGLAAFAALQIIVIPLGAMSSRRKMAAKAAKAAQEKGVYPQKFQFVFDDRMIHVTTGGETAVSTYEQIDCLIEQGPWRLLFYGRAAYILHTGDFASSEEAERFDKFVSERCGLPFNHLKGKPPLRGNN